MNGSLHLKNPLRPSANLNIVNDDKYCFLWSIVASLWPCNISHLNRVSNYGHCFAELNIQCFDFSNGFKCNDVFKFEKVNNLSINIFEINFHQELKKWKHKLTPFKNSKNESDRVSDFMIYKIIMFS